MEPLKIKYFLFVEGTPMIYEILAFKFSTTLSPNSAVPARPPMSRVRTPPLMVSSTAFSIAAASFSLPSEYRSISAAESIVPTGLTTPFPAMSGAEPSQPLETKSAHVNGGCCLPWIGS